MAIPTGATNLVTPLDAASVQCKSLPDSRFGELVFVAKAAYVSSGGDGSLAMAMPVSFDRWDSEGIPRVWDSERLTIPYPLICCDTPSAFALTTLRTLNLDPAAPVIAAFAYGSQAQIDFNQRRAFVMELFAVNAKDTLAAGILQGAATMELDDASDFPTSGYVLVEDELIFYNGKIGDVLQNLGRGAHGTVNAAHDLGVR